MLRLAQTILLANVRRLSYMYRNRKCCRQYCRQMSEMKLCNKWHKSLLESAVFQVSCLSLVSSISSELSFFSQQYFKFLPCMFSGYVYLLFESEKAVRLMLQECTHDYSSGEYYFNISSRRMRSKEVSYPPLRKLPFAEIVLKELEILMCQWNWILLLHLVVKCCFTVILYSYLISKKKINV